MMVDSCCCCPLGEKKIALEVFVEDEKVDDARAVLDPFSDLPPTVGKNEMVPGMTSLQYTPRSETEFMRAALCTLQVSVSRV